MSPSQTKPVGYTLLHSFVKRTKHQRFICLYIGTAPGSNCVPETGPQTVPYDQVLEESTVVRQDSTPSPSHCNED